MTKHVVVKHDDLVAWRAAWLLANPGALQNGRGDVLTPFDDYLIDGRAYDVTEVEKLCEALTEKSDETWQTGRHRTAELLRKASEIIRVIMNELVIATAKNAGDMRVAPLDLSNLLKHAFFAGIKKDMQEQTYTLESAWCEYDPTENKAYQRIKRALYGDTE